MIKNTVSKFLYSPSAGTSTSFSSSSLLSEPSWCIDIRMSVPPTNSLLMYSWGIVCQSLYSLIPVVSQSAQSFDGYSTTNPRRIASHHFSSRGIHNIPCLSSSSSRTLNAVNFCGLTPWSPRIWIAAREKPHCGVSGVPFINSTTGAEATALSIAERTSVERKDFCRAAKRGERRGLRRGRRVWEAAYATVSGVLGWPLWY
jgi:hypothetical protein